MRVEFEATVETVDDAFCQCISLLIQTGDDIRGEFIYETSTPDTDPDPARGVYHHTASPAGIFAELNSFLYETNPPVDVYVWVSNDVVGASGLYDQFWIRSINNLQVIGLPVDLIDVLFWDDSATALSSDKLGTLPGLEKWPFVQVDLHGGDFSYRIIGTVTSLNVIEQPVPVERTTWGRIKATYR